MAKNELLPFADGEDANVLPTNQWEALTDILENGFQSGIARSEQVNRVLAQGAVASYVLGQLIVDQLNKDATLDKDTLYQNIVKALQENAKDVCLPLSGGNVTGNLTVQGKNVLRSVNGLTADASGSVDLPNVSKYGRSYQDSQPVLGKLCLIESNATDGQPQNGVILSYGWTSDWAGQLLIPDNNSGLFVRGKTSGTWSSWKKVLCVESWRSGTSWYRKYSDGFIEQGFEVVPTDNGTRVTLPTAFAFNSYAVAYCKLQGALNADFDAVMVERTSTSVITVKAYDENKVSIILMGY